MILHTKCQGSMPYDFIQEDVFMFFLLKPMKNMLHGMGPFMALRAYFEQTW